MYRIGVWYTAAMGNPSAWPRRLLIAALALIGAGICAYFTLYERHPIATVWDPFFGSGGRAALHTRYTYAVQRYLHVPGAALGALAYLLEAILALIGSTRRWETRPWLVLAFGLMAIPLALTGMFLLMVQAAMIHVWCTLCLVSLAISVAIVFLIDKEVSAA
ncbi:MAG: vitamin epoxide reductase, partial [Acidobacteria bacterium]|nr:vitamin epoxide reductase [Acidobacteriota bacterium]